MVNKSVVLKKISHIRRNLSRLKEKGNVPLETLIEDLDIQDIVLHNLQYAVQGCIDIGSHIISDQGWGIAGSLSEIFYLLQDRGVIDRELTEKMVSMVGFRNILIHEYEDINFALVHTILKTDLKDIDEYLLKIVDYFALD